MIALDCVSDRLRPVLLSRSIEPARLARYGSELFVMCKSRREAELIARDVAGGTVAATSWQHNDSKRFPWLVDCPFGYLGGNDD